MKDTEREYKWDSPNRQAFQCFLQAVRAQCEEVVCQGSRRITDYYLDNAGKELAARKVALRIRHIGEVWQATLKSRSRLKNGLAVRKEYTLVLTGARSFGKALKRLAQKKKWKDIPVENLQEKFRICNHRRIYQCVYQNMCCELALDDYLTQAQGHQWRRREIELELKKGPAKQFTKLIKNLTKQSCLSAAKISKVAGAEKWISQKFSFN